MQIAFLGFPGFSGFPGFGLVIGFCFCGKRESSLLNMHEAGQLQIECVSL